MNGERKLLRIVPGDLGGHLARTAGTKVLMPDGTPLPNVTCIVLRAAVDDVWRAEISCYIEPPEVTALSEVHYRKFDGKPRPLWWWIRAWWLSRKPLKGPKKFGPPHRNSTSPASVGPERRGPLAAVDVDLDKRLADIQRDLRRATESSRR